MRDYTPTTSKIRDSWISRFAVDHGWVKIEDITESNAEFHRWLELFGKTERLAEQKRIIALLEAQLEGVLRAVNKGDWTVSEEIVSSTFRGDIIALIRGEN